MRIHHFLSGTDHGITVRLAVACAAVLLPLATATAAGAAPPTASLAGPPAAPRAIWGLETHPWTSGPEEALSDQQPALDDTPLTGTNIGWEDDARILGSKTVSLDGRSSYLSASPATLSTAATFSFTAWVRLTDTSVSRTLAGKAGAGRDTLTVGYDKATNRWQVRMPSKTGKGGRVAVARSVSVPRAGLWTHLAVTHDADARTLTLWVNGTAEATVSRVEAVNDPAGEFRLGRGDTGWWQGNVAQVRVYDRVLAGQDFTGWLASDPGSGGFDQSGLLTPWLVGRWSFEGATACYEEDLDPTLCSAPDSTAFDRQLTLTRGAYVVSNGGGNALELNDTHWVDDPSDPHYGETTREYGRSQVNVGRPANPVWQDGPVLLTGQSFTVSAWVRLDPARGAQTVISQDDGDRSAFHLGFEPADGGRWVFGLTDGSATVSASAPAADLDRGHHLVAVLDATRRQARLHIDGTPAGTVGLGAAWQFRQAAGSLLVGRSTTPAGPAGWLFGEIDDVNAYQGALSDMDVQRLFLGQSV
ncbi:LamG domain-containing protein [Actinoplanes philippinensis]|uniref:LamG domain-containing protein n=1 Tax=Actinoplanes philippinensis TaxID=35752 RepID=UPI0033EC462E